MKKILALVLTLLILAVALVGCEKDYVPDPAVEQYLNSGLTAQKAFETLSSVSYETTTTIFNKSGEQQGKYVNKVQFDISDKDSVTLSIINTYSGSLIEEGVTEQTVTLSKQGEKYVYETVTNVPSKNSSKEIDSQVAIDLITSLVYVDNGAYDSSGLYYGDIFMLKIYKFPAKSFYVDEQEDLCVFDEKMLILRDDLGNVRLYQTTKINRLGLLMSSYEKYESVDQDYVMVSEISATYNYVQNDD